MFVHLNVHSQFSPMRGTAPQTALIAAAKQEKMSHLALTETNGIWGFIRFVQHCRAAGILPLCGANLHTGKDEAILLVENQSGYENLCRVLSKIHEDDQQSLQDVLIHNSVGLFFLIHEEATLKSLSKLIPNSHLFVELRPGMSESHAVKLAWRYSLEIIVTGDVYFLKPLDQKTHAVLRAIDKNLTLTQLDRSEVKSEKHWFRNEKDICRLFPNSLQAIHNSQYLAERCKTDWIFINTIFPDLSLKKIQGAGKTLEELVYRGAKQRYGQITPAVEKRIKMELSMISQKGFAPYFLIVRDIVSQTKATIGRGSGAASIVSYCLFITQVDPIKYHLQFERFIHPEREDMPDIDVDFPWDERDDVLETVFKKYGLQRTAMVSTQVFLRPRSAIREVAKVYGLSNEEINSITKRIGYSRSRSDLVNWVKTDPRFTNANLDDTLSEILEIGEKAMGAFRYSSVHPGGIIIVPDEIRKFVPVLMAAKGVQIVEWEKDQVEDSGLLKIDLLGNRSLAVVRDSLKQINLNYGHQASDDKYINYHKIQPIGDIKTRRLMETGKTIGVFYIESPATRQLLAKAGVADFEHVVIYSSIIRPAANRFTNLMLERIHGKSWDLLHPDLEFLRESYGIMVYEEQVTMTARKLAGFGYAEADALRKTMTRDSMQRLLPKWKQKYTRGAQNQGYSQKIIDQTWDMIASFVGYSFCKPHSASYAMLSFTCAYIKAHYPAEFLAAVITNQGGYYSTYAYLSEARRFGIKILPPDINRSQKGYRGYKKKIRIGFMSIKGLREKAIDRVLEARKSGDFTNLDDFMLRVDMDLADAMAFTNAGCFQVLEPEQAHKEIAFRIARYYLRYSPSADLELEEKETFTVPDSTSLSKDEIRELEINSYGFPISTHPLEPYNEFLKQHVKTAREIPNYVGQTINLAGIYVTRKTTQTHQRDPMEFLTLEDQTDIYECVLFPETYRQYGDLLIWETLFILRGKIEEAYGVYTVTVEKLASLPQMVQKMSKKRTLKSFRRKGVTGIKIALAAE